jgi:hypothetical protein
MAIGCAIENILILIKPNIQVKARALDIQTKRPDKRPDQNVDSFLLASTVLV